MAKVKGRIVVDIERCKGCGVCIEVCPVKVISLNKQVNGKGYNYCYMSEPDNCIGCASCAMVCPDSCITVFRTQNSSK
ncbi:MAG TPA: ferredoxin family protein [Candidatus Avirikenella pullistercoris]|nr:ferredoxin family protein [Candidatus Avirikenella pullistercoris]